MPRLLFCLFLSVVFASSALAETLDQAIVKQTPGLLVSLKEKNVRNVGVLKFYSAQDKGPVSDVGEINSTVAERLEIALVLGGDIKDHVGVIHNATAVAAKTAHMPLALPVIQRQARGELAKPKVRLTLLRRRWQPSRIERHEPDLTLANCRVCGQF